MTESTPNLFVRLARRVYHPIGFKRGYDFSFFVITIGALLGFSLARLQYTFAFSSTFCAEDHDIGAAKGECFYYAQKLYKIGIKLHLYTIIPAGILACPQFVPIIRHRLIIFHRVNGYAVLILVIVGLVGAVMILRRAFGGGLDVQMYGGVTTILTATSLGLSYYNIKKLQIEEHRKWMLRAWAYLGTIITMRFIFVIMAIIISQHGDYYQPRQCAQVQYLEPNATRFAELYPRCISSDTGAIADGAVTLVQANINSQRPEEMAAALGLTFGSAAWLALVIHAFLVELYIHLTPAEHMRLRYISYQKQLEAGMKTPGSADLTVRRVCDASYWKPVGSDSSGEQKVKWTRTESHVNLSVR